MLVKILNFHFIFIFLQGKERYKVRWVGYPASNDTWEPRENLLPCIEMVEDFERDRQRLKKRRAEERRIRKVKNFLLRDF